MYYIISFIGITLPHQFFNVVCHTFGFSYEKLGEQLEPKEGQKMETSGPQLAL